MYDVVQITQHFVQSIIYIYIYIYCQVFLQNFSKFFVSRRKSGDTQRKQSRAG